MSAAVHTAHPDADGSHHGIGIGRANNAHMELVWETDIPNEGASPGEQRRVLQPSHREGGSLTEMQEAQASPAHYTRRDRASSVMMPFPHPKGSYGDA